jgi:hypothetical protein
MQRQSKEVSFLNFKDALRKPGEFTMPDWSKVLFLFVQLWSLFLFPNVQQTIDSPFRWSVLVKRTSRGKRCVCFASCMVAIQPRPGVYNDHIFVVACCCCCSFLQESDSLHQCGTSVRIASSGKQHQHQAQGHEFLISTLSFRFIS